MTQEPPSARVAWTRGVSTSDAIHAHACTRKTRSPHHAQRAALRFRRESSASLSGAHPLNIHAEQPRFLPLLHPPHSSPGPLPCPKTVQSLRIRTFGGIARLNERPGAYRFGTKVQAHIPYTSVQSKKITGMAHETRMHTHTRTHRRRGTAAPSGPTGRIYASTHALSTLLSLISRVVRSRRRKGQS